MATSVMQIRVDDELKQEASILYEKLGIDLSTAVRMFLKRSVMENGIPFSMVIPREESRAAQAVLAMRQLSEEAQRNGTADMTLDEINAEINEVRAGRRTV